MKNRNKVSRGLFLSCLISQGFWAASSLILLLLFCAAALSMDDPDSVTKPLSLCSLYIGAVVGGLIGYGVGTVGSKIFTALAKTGTKVSKGTGYKSFEALKRKLGSAGKNNQWHHIVEQHSGNISKFGATKIHNTANIVKVPGGFKGSLHSKLTGYYNSVDRALTGGKTVRNWLSTKSYAYQYEFGVKKILEFAEKLGVKVFLP